MVHNRCPISIESIRFDLFHPLHKMSLKIGLKQNLIPLYELKSSSVLNPSTRPKTHFQCFRLNLDVLCIFEEDKVHIQQTLPLPFGSQKGMRGKGRFNKVTKTGTTPRRALPPGKRTLSKNHQVAGRFVTEAHS